MKTPSDEQPESQLSGLDWKSIPFNRDEVGIVVVDHGSRRRESNEMLDRVVALYRNVAPFTIIEPAHMELARPSINDAFAKCVEAGAKLIVVHPYFLLPGRHWDQDIPRLAAEAASEHVGTKFLVTSPLSLHPLMAEVIQARVEQCLAHALGQGPDCELCADTGKCQL